MLRKQKPESYHFKPLYQSYFRENWFKKIDNYLKVRFPPIVNRLIDTFRYVDFHPINKGTYSYEFTSLLRDIGGAISSVLDSFILGVWGPPKNKYQRKKEYNMGDYRDFLLDEISNLEKVVVILNVNFDEKYLIPFKIIERNKKFNPVWWEAYNKVKHKDIHSLQMGCLSNVIYGFGALSILVDSIITLDIRTGSSMTYESVFSLNRISILTRNLIAYIGDVTSDVKIKEFPYV